MLIDLTLRFDPSPQPEAPLLLPYETGLAGALLHSG